jgi:hypothetical protein
MTAIVKCERRDLGSDGVLVVDRVEIAAKSVPEEGEETFVFWHDVEPGTAWLAMRGVLSTFTPLPRQPPHHQKARIEIRVTERSPSQELFVKDLHKDSNIAAERTLFAKVSGFRPTKIGRLEIQGSCYLRGKFRDPQPNNDIEAEEGYQGDRTIAFRSRNEAMIASCKARDDYRCQACQFRLDLHGSYIIDCHHKYPFAGVPGVRVTKLNDLICLCPTCHRIAHTRKSPLTVEEIRAARRATGLP